MRMCKELVRTYGDLFAILVILNVYN